MVCFGVMGGCGGSTSLRKSGTEGRDMPEAKGLRAADRGVGASGAAGRDLERLP